MKYILILVALLTMATLLLATAYFYHGPEPQVTTILSQGPTVERLERLTHLVSTRVCVADVLTAEGDGCRGAWLIKGDALIGVNLTRAKILQKDDDTRRATLCLPLPEVIQSRVDHTRTRTWEVKKTSWAPWRGDQDMLRDQVMAEAQKLVAHVAGSPEYLQQAKLTAETVVRAIYEEVGWQVQVTWDGTPKP